MVSDGWKTPDTYNNHFDMPGLFPAVYLFALFDPDRFDKALVAYVGMSKQVSARWAGHNILPELRESQYWPQRWFKRVKPAQLRVEEARLIQAFDPPWNIIGRRRGVMVQ